MKKLAVSGMVALCLAVGSPVSALTFDTDPITFADLPENFDVVDPATFVAHDVWEAATTFLSVAGPKSAGKLDYPNVLASRSGDSGGTNPTPITVDPVTLEFIYLGSEAKYGNTTYLGGEKLFDNNVSVFGDRREISWTGGRLDFRFCTDRGTPELGDDGCISNDPERNTGMATELEIAVSRIFEYMGDPAVVFFFGDGAASNDGDLDDLVVAARIVSSVPVPAGIFLLGTATLGLGGASIRRKRRHDQV